jgi:HEAT repeat protein
MDFVAQAVQDVRGNDAFKRGDALRRLERAPDDQKKRKDFEDARADAGKRREVNAALVEVLKGNDRGNKRGAASALKLWLTPDAVPDVIALLDNADRGDALLLIELLGDSKDARAVPALVKQLKTHGITAMRALEAIGPAGTKDLAAALDDDKSDRIKVCRVLEQVGTAEALPALKKLGADPKGGLAAVVARNAAKKIEERTKK